MSEQYVCTHCGYVMVPTGVEPDHICATAGCLLCRGQVTHESAPAVSPEGNPGSGTRPQGEPGETDSQGFHTGYQAGVAATTEPVGSLADTIIALHARIEKLRAALSSLLEPARTVHIGSRMVYLDSTLTPEAYAALRALLAEPGA